MRGITSLEYMLLLDNGGVVPVEGDELNKMKIVKQKLSPAVLSVITGFHAQPRSEPMPQNETLAPQKRNVGAVAVRPAVTNFERMFDIARPLAFKKEWQLSDLEELLLTEIQALRPVTPEDTEAIRQQLSGSSEHADRMAADFRLMLDLGALGNCAFKFFEKGLA